MFPLFARKAGVVPFPEIISSVTSTGLNESDGQFTISLPSGIQAGELIFFHIGARSTISARTITTPFGYNLIFSTAGSGNLRRHAAFWKIANGFEGTSRTINLSGSAHIAAIAYRIKNATSASGSATTGSSGNSNPPTHSPTSPGKLWIACSMILGTDGTTAPSNYTGFVGVTSYNVLRAASAHRYLKLSSENPGSFPNTFSEGWSAGTVAIW